MDRKEIQEYMRQVARSVAMYKAQASDVLDNIDILCIARPHDIEYFLRIVIHSAKVLASASIAVSDLVATAEIAEDGKVIKEWDFTKE